MRRTWGGRSVRLISVLTTAIFICSQYAFCDICGRVNPDNYLRRNLEIGSDNTLNPSYLRSTEQKHLELIRQKTDNLETMRQLNIINSNVGEADLNVPLKRKSSVSTNNNDVPKDIVLDFTGYPRAVSQPAVEDTGEKGLFRRYLEKNSLKDIWVTLKGELMGYDIDIRYMNTSDNISLIQGTVDGVHVDIRFYPEDLSVCTEYFNHLYDKDRESYIYVDRPVLDERIKQGNSDVGKLHLFSKFNLQEKLFSEVERRGDRMSASSEGRVNIQFSQNMKNEIACTKAIMIFLFMNIKDPGQDETSFEKETLSSNDVLTLSALDSGFFGVKNNLPHLTENRDEKSSGVFHVRPKPLPKDRIIADDLSLSTEELVRLIGIMNDPSFMKLMESMLVNIDELSLKNATLLEQIKKHYIEFLARYTTNGRSGIDSLESIQGVLRSGSQTEMLSDVIMDVENFILLVKEGKLNMSQKETAEILAGYDKLRKDTDSDVLQYFTELRTMKNVASKIYETLKSSDSSVVYIKENEDSAKILISIKDAGDKQEKVPHRELSSKKDHGEVFTRSEMPVF